MRYARIFCGWSKRLKPNESSSAFIRRAWLCFVASTVARTPGHHLTELTGTFETISVATGGEIVIPRLVFTRLVLSSAHTKKIDANKHMTANKPV
jgi:hypothetical protein